MQSIRRYYQKSIDIICGIFKDALESSAVTCADLASILRIATENTRMWTHSEAIPPRHIPKVEELLGIDFISEILDKSDAIYFWNRFHRVLDGVCGSEQLLRKAKFLDYYVQHYDEFPRTTSRMGAIVPYIKAIDGFPEMMEAWYSYLYIERIKQQKAFYNKTNCPEKDDSSLETAEPEQSSVTEVAPEICRDTERNAPSTLYICMDRVKTYAEDQGVSLTSENLELYANMAASYIYQFFFGAKFDSVPRNFPMSDDDKGPYYYVEDHIFHSIKKLEDFDFSGYLKRHNVTVVLTFDQDNDTITKRLKS